MSGTQLLSLQITLPIFLPCTQEYLKKTPWKELNLKIIILAMKRRYSTCWKKQRKKKKEKKSHKIIPTWMPQISLWELHLITAKHSHNNTQHSQSLTKYKLSNSAITVRYKALYKNNKDNLTEKEEQWRRDNTGFF